LEILFFLFVFSAAAIENYGILTSSTYSSTNFTGGEKAILQKVKVEKMPSGGAKDANEDGKKKRKEGVLEKDGENEKDEGFRKYYYYFLLEIKKIKN
jgi:hypothetical protein